MARAKDAVLRALRGEDDVKPPLDHDDLVGKPTEDLVEDIDDLPPDPAPKKTRTAVKRASATTVRRVRDEISVMIMLAGGTLSVRDPYCGGALNDQSEAIAAALADILATKPALLKWFEGFSGIGGYMRLFLAIKPVVEAIAAHHITRTALEETDDHGHSSLADFPPFRPGEHYAAS